MGKLKVLIGLAALALVVMAGWQVASAYIGNAELHEDLRDIAANMGVRVGLSAPPTDDDMRRYVIEKASGHGIELEPSQIKVTETGSGKDLVFSLAVDYHARLNLFVFSFPMHFTSTSER